MVQRGENDEPSAGMPSLPGTYALVLRFSKRLEFSVGRLGVLSAQAGYYLYVGSALGPGGLAARVGRHYRREKTLRWHVDYVRAVARPGRSVVRDGKSHRECRWARILQSLPGASVPLTGFGAVGLRLPIAPALLYHAADRGGFSEEARQPEDRAAAASRWIAIGRRLHPRLAWCGAVESHPNRSFDSEPCSQPLRRGFV